MIILIELITLGRNREGLKARRQEKAMMAKAQRTDKLKEERAKEQREERRKREKEAQSQERLHAKAAEERLQTIAHEALRDAEVVLQDYNEYVGDRREYVDTLYRDYITPGCDDAPKAPEFFTQLIRPLEIMDTELRQLMNRVYRRCGVVNEWSRIKEIQYEVRQTVLWVNDMECSAMLGLSELIRAYERKELDFMRGLL
ncbi:hypothetical protein PM082_002181 [Marasmius tenuissimus]|nr:hypothetical protein PM082_002181 [Marasmius tenuissimus]